MQGFKWKLSGHCCLRVRVKVECAISADSVARCGRGDVWSVSLSTVLKERGLLRGATKRAGQYAKERWAKTKNAKLRKLETWRSFGCGRVVWQAVWWSAGRADWTGSAGWDCLLSTITLSCCEPGRPLILKACGGLLTLSLSLPKHNLSLSLSLYLKLSLKFGVRLGLS